MRTEFFRTSSPFIRAVQQLHSPVAAHPGWWPTLGWAQERDRCRWLVFWTCPAIPCSAAALLPLRAVTSGATSSLESSTYSVAETHNFLNLRRSAFLAYRYGELCLLEKSNNSQIHFHKQWRKDFLQNRKEKLRCEHLKTSLKLQHVYLWSHHSSSFFFRSGSDLNKGSPHF